MLFWESRQLYTDICCGKAGLTRLFNGVLCIVGIIIYEFRKERYKEE